MSVMIRPTFFQTGSSVVLIRTELCHSIKFFDFSTYHCFLSEMWCRRERFEDGQGWIYEATL